MEKRKLILGTRGSKLALRQAELVLEAIRGTAPEVDVALEIIKTEGDRVLGVPLATLGGTGVFVKEIESALIERRIDIAVHSMKDLPTQMPEALALAAVPVREDARDALLSKTGLPLAQLPPGARVGTGSPRRRAQLLHLRSDLEVGDLRGNLQTRLRRLDEGKYDAIVLAAAGLRRLGLHERIAEVFSFEQMLPAPGQGALAVQIRAGDDVLQLLNSLDDPAARVAAMAERAFLAGTGGGCHTPVGAHATVSGGSVHLEGRIATLDGSTVVRDRIEGDPADAERLGRRLARAVLEQGGGEILAGLSTDNAS